MTDASNSERALLIDPLSTAPAFMEMFFGTTRLASGTCSFVKRNGTAYLVTNWHNLAGRDAATHQVLHPQAAIPNAVRVYHHDLNRLGTTHVASYALQDESEKAIWFEHALYGSKVDVGILPLPELSETLLYPVDKAVQDADPYDKLGLEVGEVVFVLGYPYEIAASHYFPIWKAAFIASEPDLNMEGLPLLYIDTATRPGMSGAPVVQKTRRAVALMRNGHDVSQYCYDFLGIYSGRLSAQNDLDAQIGRVWKVKVIDEILTAQKHAPGYEMS